MPFVYRQTPVMAAGIRHRPYTAPTAISSIRRSLSIYPTMLAVLVPHMLIPLMSHISSMMCGNYMLCPPPPPPPPTRVMMPLLSIAPRLSTSMWQHVVD